MLCSTPPPPPPPPQKLANGLGCENSAPLTDGQKSTAIGAAIGAGVLGFGGIVALGVALARYFGGNKDDEDDED